MFKKTSKEATAHSIELTTECQAALLKLEDDTSALIELLHELIDEQRVIHRLLRAEIDVPVVDEPRRVETGVETFQDAPEESFAAIEIQSGDPSIRESPFRRAPRHTQIAWLHRVMGDGAWYSALGIADRYATDERNRRYMRSAVGGRLREMYEDGEAERRAATPRNGSMFEYRLKGAKG